MTMRGARRGLIIGEPSAGANGNATTFVLPGGYSIAWTGMQVLDAKRQTHHTIGVIPDVRVKRTIAGVSAGRDEVLEQALKLVETGRARTLLDRMADAHSSEQKK